jgi:hypothetical protein
MKKITQPKKHKYYIIDMGDINNLKWINMGYHTPEAAREVAERLPITFMISKGIEIILAKAHMVMVPYQKYGIKLNKESHIPLGLNLSRLTLPTDGLDDPKKRKSHFDRAITKAKAILKNL